MRQNTALGTVSPDPQLNRQAFQQPLTAPKWSAETLSRYDLRGPRYTSYPSANEFSGDFQPELYTQALMQARHSEDALSLYIHIPFCENICYYCACNKIVTRDRSKADLYLDYLYKEIDMIAQLLGSSREVKALHFGGGTPTFLDHAQLTELVYQLAAKFTLSSSDQREFSIEIDPRTVHKDTLNLLRGLGFNRLSLGVQDFDEEVQRAVNRIQSHEHVSDLVAQARLTGFESISFDLIYGLPKQNSSSFEKTIDQVLELMPDRISLYNYAHLPKQVPSQRSIDRMQLPSADAKLEMLCIAAEKLQAHTYCYIGMDHFALASDEMSIAASTGRLQRSFQGYSVVHAPETIGMGVSAISSLADMYVQNHKVLDQYYYALDQARLPVARGLSLSSDDKVRRDVINQIISTLSLDKNAFKQQVGQDFDQYFATAQEGLRQAERDGLVKLSSDAIVVTGTGRLLLRNICMLFDDYLPASSAQFSQTI